MGPENKTTNALSMKRIGKRTKEWIEARAELEKIYREKGIKSCEVKLNKCMRKFGLSFAHRHKRIYYYDKPGLLGSFNETVKACASCHAEIENDKLLTEEIFNRLRR